MYEFVSDTNLGFLIGDNIAQISINQSAIRLEFFGPQKTTIDIYEFITFTYHPASNWFLYHTNVVWADGKAYRNIERLFSILGVKIVEYKIEYNSLQLIFENSGRLFIYGKDDEYDCFNISSENISILV
jgi:hypothetical protein